MLCLTEAHRYSINSTLPDGQNANKCLDKTGDDDTTLKMNPPWTYQSISEGSSYGASQCGPIPSQHGFQRGWSFGGPNQRSSTVPSKGYEQGDYRSYFFGTANQPKFASGAEQRPADDNTAYSRPIPPWQQRPEPNHSGWRNEAVHSATPSQHQDYGGVEQRSYHAAQYQYAPTHFQYQPTQQFAISHHAAMQNMLMQQWQLGNIRPPNSFTPINTAQPQILDANAAAFVPERTKKLVDKAFQGKSLVDIQNRKRRAKANRATQQSEFVNEPVAGSTLDNGHAAIPPQSLLYETNGNAKTPKPALTLEKQHVMERPVPNARYLEKASKEPQVLKSGRPLLVVLDLNGTLLHRRKIGTTNFIARPRVNEFLHYLFSEHHVLVWSSVMPATLDGMVRKLLFKTQHDRLVGCWGRDKLAIPARNFHENVYTYKQLSWIWKDESIMAKNPDPVDFWCSENTVLIDDSLYKASSEPFNAILVEDFKGEKEQMESDVLGQVVRYLETLKYQSDVSAYIKSRAFEYDSQAPPFDWMPIINEMH